MLKNIYLFIKKKLKYSWYDLKIEGALLVDHKVRILGAGIFFKGRNYFSMLIQLVYQIYLKKPGLSYIASFKSFK